MSKELSKEDVLKRTLEAYIKNNDDLRRKLCSSLCLAHKLHVYGRQVIEYVTEVFEAIPLPANSETSKAFSAFSCFLEEGVKEGLFETSPDAQKVFGEFFHALEVENGKVNEARGSSPASPATLGSSVKKKKGSVKRQVKDVSRKKK